jgi:hypothetical protein
MKRLRISLLIVAILCLSQIAWFRYHVRHGQGGEVLVSELTLGWPSSPWYNRLEQVGGATVNIYPFSWTTLIALAGLGCLVSFFWLRPRRAAA